MTPLIALAIALAFFGDPQSVSSANDVKVQATSPAATGGNDLGPPYNQLLDPSGSGPPYPIYTVTGSWPIGAFGPSPPTTTIEGADVDGVISE